MQIFHLFSHFLPRSGPVFAATRGGVNRRRVCLSLKKLLEPPHHMVNKRNSRKRSVFPSGEAKRYLNLNRLDQQHAWSSIIGGDLSRMCAGFCFATAFRSNVSFLLLIGYLSTGSRSTAQNVQLKPKVSLFERRLTEPDQGRERTWSFCLVKKPVFERQANKGEDQLTMCTVIIKCVSALDPNIDDNQSRKEPANYTLTHLLFCLAIYFDG